MGCFSSKQKPSSNINEFLLSIKYDAVWNKRFPNKENQICPLCRNNRMRRERSQIRKNNWNKAYIRYYGGEDINNIIPICHKCHYKYNQNVNINLINISKGNHDRKLIY